MLKIKVINVIASSLDGQIARQSNETVEDRQKYGFVNQDDYNWARERLQKCQAVVVGATTFRASGYWHERNLQGEVPLWVIFTQTGDGLSELLKKEKNTEFLIVSKLPVSSLPKNTANLAYKNEIATDLLFQEFQRRKIQNVVLFGGGQINALFYAKGLVQELHLTLCPFLLGSPMGSLFLTPSLPQPQEMRLKSNVIRKNHIFLEYDIA